MWCSSTIALILINILQISLQSLDKDTSGCSENGCFSVFWEKIFGPKMRELIKSEFLEFKEEKLKELEKFDDEKCSCGKYLLREMQKIEYGDWHFRVWPEAIGKGSTSNIFHAHSVSNLVDFDEKPLRLKKCFALKSVLLKKAGNSESGMRNEMKILKKFARINSKHVIRLYAFKDLSESLPRQLLFLMELGEYSLKEEFKNMKEQMENIWQTNKVHSEKLIEIEEIIKRKFIEILQAVKEMHKLIIHLDLKPANLLYVKASDGKGGHKMTLKIIDFGGSEFIPENSETIVEKRADVCKFRKTMWLSLFYASPEQRKYCNKFSHRNEFEFSTKSDIWAVGVILLEMIKNTPIFKNEIAGVDIGLAINKIERMFESGGDLIDIRKQQKPLRKIVITLRDKFSQLFSKILKATVNKMPIKRTSARGLLEFLAGNCHLKLLQEKIKFKSNPQQYIEREYVEVTIFGQNSQQEPKPECDQETTGNPFALSDEVKSNESAEIMEENIDLGKLSKNRQRKLLFLIEMGEYDLFEEFKNLKNIMENIWQRNKDKSEKLIEIEEIIKNKFIEILQAVKEMHKLAIHLDMKPENMIYVNEGNKMILKIIDFGGSELIPENSKNITERRANVCKLRKEMWHTEFYASPEQRIYCDKYRNYKFSTKSDIWSVGVILLEMITYAPMYKKEIAQFSVYSALELIKEMFEKGGDLIDIEKQGSRLYDILFTLRDQFSHLFSSILKVTVNKVPVERTTARGLLHFIPGKCHLKVPLKRIVDKSNPHKYVEETIFEQNSQQEMLLPDCDQETTGNPLALSDEVKSNELEVKLHENIVV